MPEKTGPFVLTLLTVAIIYVAYVSYWSGYHDGVRAGEAKAYSTIQQRLDRL